MSNAIKGAFHSKTQSVIANQVAWQPYKTSSNGEYFCGKVGGSGSTHCGTPCDSFYYSSSKHGGWGMGFDDDTGWHCHAFKMGFTGAPGINGNDWGFIDGQQKQSDFGALYYRNYSEE